ncbi:MAG: hypothetical protein LBU95_03890 [Rikenellaceae bacterium]|jgi:hypothetical protein|nr:hypothetical protein [Rikenellaceae bacterium]
MAKKIFRNINMSDANWAVIENMLAKIMADCMGGAMYNALDGLLGSQTFAIQFDLNAQTSTFDGNTISLNSFESNSLFHEMFHAYQAYQETPTTYDDAIANLEVEANIAQYRYLMSLPEVTPGSKWAQTYKEGFGRNVAKLSNRYISKSGTLIDQSKSTMFTSIFSGAGSMVVSMYAQTGRTISFDYTRSVTQNLKNLANLSGGC